LNPSLDVSQYAHNAWTSRDGFTAGNIFAMAQTPDGYFWLGGEFGLFRFDGVRAVPWQPPAGQEMPEKFAFQMVGARDGTLWIGTFSGLASWDGVKLTRHAEFAGRFVQCVYEDREGTVWAATRGGVGSYTRLCAMRRGSSQCFGDDGALGKTVWSIHEDRSGVLWVGTDSGLWQWKPGPPRRESAEPRDISGMTETEDGRILASRFGGGLMQLAGRFHAPPAPYPTRPPIGSARPLAGRELNANTLLRDRGGGLWIGTMEHGLVHLHNGRTDVFTKSNGLSGDIVLCLFEDSEGNIWVSTTGGIDRFREFPVTTISSKEGLASDAAVSVSGGSDGSVWIGTLQGLTRWKNGQPTIFRTANGLPGNSVESLFQDGGGRLWLYAAAELAYFNGNRFITLPRAVPSEEAHSITGDSEGNLWLAGNEGLYRVREGRVVEKQPWPALGEAERAKVIVADRDGVWISFWGTRTVSYFKDGGIRARYKAADGIGKGRIADIRLDGDGALWVATEEGGISRIKNGQIATLTTTNGLPCDAIHCSIEDDDRSLWLYTACGLVRIARSELNAWVADPRHRVVTTVLDSADGARLRALSPSSFSPVAAKSSDGKLWFVTGDSVQVVDPRHLPYNHLPPPVHIERIVADRKTYWRRLTGVEVPNVRLPARIRDLQIDYTAVSLVAPEKVHFKYKLEKQDQDWREVVNDRQVQYSNLSPGSYRFRVIASNNSGVWNESGDGLEFSIAPAYYQTIWFRAFVAAAILVMMGAAYQFRVWQVQRESRRLRDVIETIPAYVWSAQPDGSVDFVNRRWLEFSGFSLNQAIGWGWADALHPEDRGHLVEGWRAAIAAGKAMEAEARMCGADGQYRWLLFRSVPQRDRSGKIVKWYGKSIDITELKRAEEERERLHELESELAHLNRVSMMGELSSSIAHEVNQPLAGIVSNGSAGLRFLSGDTPDVEETREALRDIVRDGKRAGEIIRRIRALTKRTELPREKLDLNETIREVVPLVGDEAKKNSVTIRTQLAGEVSPVLGDRVQLQQVLLNLVINAIQAMSSVSDRAHQLVISTRNIDHDQVQVTVEDSGIGLDPDKISRIFEPFYTTKSGGMGMGLSICRSILHSHGGRLWATANEGPGASFHFTLPKCEGEESKAGAAAD
jgi:PAS domain S-box-containing protein